jgi:Domain of unknown function (DUF397).
MTPPGAAISEDAKKPPSRWRKSSYSNDGGNCVEVAARAPGGVAIRDSKNPGGPALTLTSAEWRTFLRAVKTGRVGR